MSATRVHPVQAAGRPWPDRRWRLGGALASLLLPVVACAAITGGEAASPEDIRVLVDGTGEADGAVTEWTGGAGDFDDHPYKPEGVEISVAYPEFTGAEEFAVGLRARVDQEVQDFRGAGRDPVSLDIDWDVVAAGSGVLGVRLVSTEQDLQGTRHRYGTYWYDAETGLTRYATELLQGQDELERLNSLVAATLADHPDVELDGLHPILGSYDSMGFNADGDLVVEFDDGHLSPMREGHPPDPSPGRIVAVVGSAEAAPLLSGFGARAREAALVEEPDFDVPEPGVDPDEPPEVPGKVMAGSSGMDCSDEVIKCIALTFDDGPADTTAHMLDLLAKEDVTATFFLNGNPALTRPGVVRRTYAEGHEVANHNDLHEHMPEFDVEELPAQVAAVSAMVRRETGHTVELFRPPFGASSPEVIGEIGDQGMAEVLWSMDSEDWTEIDRDQIVEQVLHQAKPGGVVLLHDTLPVTLAAMPEIIERLREKDYEFVTVTEAVGGTEVGESYPEGETVPEMEG